MQKHNNWRRLLRRTLEEMYASIQIAKHTSWFGALLVFWTKFEIQLINRRGYYETKGTTRRLLKKHAVMRRYFDETYSDFLAAYDFNKPMPERDPDMRDRIWMCWWQGQEKAPDIAKKCMESVRKNASGREVVVITEKNYKEYVQLPQWLEEKYRMGIISRTHFSDVLRMHLLATYGGMWLDATVFCAEGGVDACFREPVWSIKRPGYGHISVGCGDFVTGTMQCGYEYRWVYVIFKDFLLHYWRSNDFLVDYLMLDYLIDLVRRNNRHVNDVFSRIEPNNARSDNLIKIMNMPYDDALWQDMKRDTALFTLSWKQKYVLEKDGKETFYAKLLKGEL